MFPVDSDFRLPSSASSVDPDESRSSIFSDDSSLDSSFELEFDPLAQQLCLRADSIESLDEMATDQQSSEFMAFKNTSALCEDLRFIPGMPEMCDVKFLVGDDKVPVYGVKAILATRSRRRYNLILSAKKAERKEIWQQKNKKNTLVSMLRNLKKRKFTSKKNVQKNTGRKAPSHVTVEVKEFEADTFSRVILFIQSGAINVNINSVIGVMNAADRFGLEDLRSACFQFARGFINLRTVPALLTATENYPNFKWTKKIRNEILDFICRNPQDIFALPDFEQLSKASVILIMSRRDLRTSEETKWDVALKWSRRHCQHPGDSLPDILKHFTHSINFLNIPLCKLVEEIHPLYAITESHSEQTTDYQRAPVAQTDDVGDIADNFRNRKSSVTSTSSEYSRGGHSMDSGYNSSTEVFEI